MPWVILNVETGELLKKVSVRNKSNMPHPAKDIYGNIIRTRFLLPFLLSNYCFSLFNESKGTPSHLQPWFMHSMHRGNFEATETVVTFGSLREAANIFIDNTPYYTDNPGNLHKFQFMLLSHKNNRVLCSVDIGNTNKPDPYLWYKTTKQRDLK